MTSTMSHPSVIQPLPPSTQQYYKQQQPQPTSLHSEAIEMRPTAGFTRLPQNPPPQQPVVNSQMETTMSNGAALTSPIYPHPPSYTREDRANINNMTMGPHVSFPHSHNYEELPIAKETSTDQVSLENVNSFQRQESHTEVDQYFNPPVHSISSTRLTITEPTEKRPRKKVNPIYDRYQGPTDKITTTKDGSQKRMKPSKGKCSKFPGRCLRHPATTVFIFLLVAVIIVAVVLIMLGTIETPGSLPAGPDSRVQITSAATKDPQTTPLPDISPEMLLNMIRNQERTIQILQEKVNMLEGVLGGGNEVNASLSARVAMNSFKIDNIDAGVKTAGKNISLVNNRVDLFEGSLSGTLVRLENTVTRTTILENNTRQLDISVRQLNAKAQTQSTDILENKEKNNAQDASISSAQQQLSILDQKFALNLAEANRTIFDRLDTISKMEGPRGYNGSVGPAGPQGIQGVPGAGDLTMCEYKRYTDSSTYADVTSGQWKTQPIDKVFTGVTCSTEGGELAVLYSEPTTSGTMRYRCKCAGESTDITSSRRQCVIHYWQCPATS